jgi:hypothetical protein
MEMPASSSFPDTKKKRVRRINIVFIESTWPHTAELYIIAGLNKYDNIIRRAVLNSAYFFTIMNIKKEVIMSIILAGLFISIVNMVVLISKEDEKKL